MSIEDLREQGVLLPEEEWGEHRLQTTIRQGPLLVSFVIAVAALVVAYLGEGGGLTWMGVVAFFLAFFGMVWICDRAIPRQRRRFRYERQTAPTDTE